ncbi:protein ENHANCED DISEASE RESISTANCE 2 isoform X2 [Impatiens glandulifera]|uniref:protein ENHANCED DISEASE RESISTANCE 2 isoform X2 n=1 Tax=Impatiens glandulifera TaxID=253017 RepID=UPI001FB192A6|nr:protein ENHANCED DISEASE RESISTANCE 2 isoform X2 [Impatiens glandulifera]
MAAVSQTDDATNMQGWLYLIRSNRLGLQSLRNRYFLLQDHHLRSFKSLPASHHDDPIRIAMIDSSIRVTENGRENIQRKVLFTFTLYNVSNHGDRLKLGASSPDEAARWILSLQEKTLKTGQIKEQNGFAGSKISLRSFRAWNRCKYYGRHHGSYSKDWMISSRIHIDSMSFDVITPSSWTIFGCHNGLRLFKEAKDRDACAKWNDHPAIMAIGVVNGTSEAVFQTLMSLGVSRTEWDFCFNEGTIIENLDGHTDIIHVLLASDWFPWGMNRRDLLVRRYWRREDDGTYVILFHSVFHKRCPPKKGYIRACIQSGGYVVSPMNEGKQSVVKHMLAIDWKLWRSYLQRSSAKSITIQMLERIAALRELFRAKPECFTSSDVGVREIKSPKIEENMVQSRNDEEGAQTPSNCSLVGLDDDEPDEFFDVLEPLDSDQSSDNNDWHSNFHQDMYAQETRQTKLSTAAGLVKKLHDLAVLKRGYVDLLEMAKDDCVSWYYGSTLPKDQSCNLLCSWMEADPSTFLIRGDTYLEDHKKVTAKGSLMEMVGADWVRSDKREDDLGGRPGSIVQKHAENGGQEFFFIVNIQVPGSTTTYSLALYYMTKTPVQEIPLLESFIKGDDAYRNSRFKLIPHIPKGSWIVKQSVGKKACLAGQALEINYFQGNNYIELGINIGSSTVARGVVSLVLGYLNNLVIEMAFLIQGNTLDELPERLLGTCRLNHLDASKAVSINS